MPAQFQDPESGSDTDQVTPFDSLLVQCRDLVCDRLSAALGGMLDKAEEALAALSNETRDATLKKLYVRTRDKALAEREAIEKQFRARYLREFQQRSNRVKKIGDSFAAIDLSSLELELVGTDDLDESLKFNAMAARLRQYCDEELGALDQRVGVLLGDASLQTEDNPFTPQAICDAYKHTCRQVDSDVEVRLVLLRLFDDHVADEIRAIYKAVNALLVQNSILPKIRLSAKKEASKPLPAAQPAAEPPKANAPAAMAPRPTVPAQPTLPEGEQDLFSILKNLRAGSADVMPRAGVGAATSHAGGGGTAAQQTLVQGAELMGLLTRIQLGDATATPASILPMAHAGSGGMGMENVLRELKNTSVGTGMNQLDMMTLDIMSLVFDQLFDDPKIPVGVKGLIGRLQIPMLKVAIADKTFFSKKTHPARQLLDTLGDISLRLPADFNTASPLFRSMEVILQELIDRFESDMDVFDVARKRVETLIAEEDQRVQKETESAASRIEQNERLGLAKTVAQAEIRARARIADVPAPVLEFLVEQWVQVLLVIHVVDGEESENWKSALETMDLLIWSVEPKQTVDERRELAVIVPEVLQRIAAGLRKVEIDDVVRRKFFADLMALHTGIIGRPDAEEQPAEPKNTSGTNEIAVDAKTQLEPDTLEMPPVTSTPPAAHPTPVPDQQLAAISGSEPVLAKPEQAGGAASSTSPALDFAPTPKSEPEPHPIAESAANASQAAPASPADGMPALVPDLEFMQQTPGADAGTDSDPHEASAKPDLVAPTASPPAPEHKSVLPDLEFPGAPLAQPPRVDLPTPAAESTPSPDSTFRLDIAIPPSSDGASAAPASAAPPFPDLNLVPLEIFPTTSAAPPKNQAPAPPDIAKPLAPPASGPSTAKPTAATTAPANAAPGVKPALAPHVPGPPAARPTGTPPGPGSPARPGVAQPAAAQHAVPSGGKTAPATSSAQAAARPVAPAPGAQAARPQPARPGTSPATKPASPPGDRPTSPSRSGTAAPARPAISAAGKSPTAPQSRPEAKAADSLDFTASVTVQNPFGGGKVQVDDLDFTVKPASSAAGPKVEAVPAELPSKLAIGTWVGIRDKDDKTARKSAKLSFISPLKTRYLFVDKQGKTMLDCSRAELARRFQVGDIVIMDKVPDVPLFDRLTDGLVGKLGGSKPRR